MKGRGRAPSVCRHRAGAEGREDYKRHLSSGRSGKGDQRASCAPRSAGPGLIKPQSAACSLTPPTGLPCMAFHSSMSLWCPKRGEQWDQVGPWPRNCTMRDSLFEIMSCQTFLTKGLVVVWALRAHGSCSTLPSWHGSSHRCSVREVAEML